MRFLRSARLFILDAALMVAFALAFACVVKGGKAGGLIAASLAIAAFLSATVLEQIQVRRPEGQARLLNRHNQALEVGKVQRGVGAVRQCRVDARGVAQPAMKERSQVGESGRLPRVEPSLSLVQPLGDETWIDSPTQGWRMSR